MTAKRLGLVDVVLTADEIVVRPRGIWKLWSLCRSMTIPRQSIRSAHVSQTPDREIAPRSRMGLGTLASLAGYMRGAQGRSWWCYQYGQSAVVLDLGLAKLSNAVFITDDNEAIVEALTQSTEVVS